MELPPAGSARRTPPPKSPSGVRLASATEALNGSISATASGRGRGSEADRGSADSFSPRARYGYAPDYRWLRGRLEHSQIDRHWKLRYIPIDGSTDEFGGSVVISNPELLGGYQRGQFVEVHGNLGPRAQDKQQYAPDFEVHQIRRLGS